MRHRTNRFWSAVAFLAGALFAAGCGGAASSGDDALDVAEALAADTVGFARADHVRDLSFPSDHGPHPDFRTEWWYYTGNLSSADGRRFGYQFTIFRIALRPDTEADASDGSWTTNQLYMAHFALTNAESGTFLFQERFSRASAGLAGAQAEPYRVWLEDWQVAAVGSSFEDQVISVSAGDSQLELRLKAEKPIVLHGDHGLDPKGPEPGNASYYYALTRWMATGTIWIGGARFEVSGTSWLDREWSTSVLEEGVRGWDWFALQLDDGTDVMYYQLRNETGEPTAYSGGVVIDADGQMHPFSIDAARLDETGRWTSPRGGTYPSSWRLEVPDEGMSLRIMPVMKDQELSASVRYWEGAVDVDGTLRGTDVRGVGYVELTGYAEQSRSQLARQ